MTHSYDGRSQASRLSVGVDLVEIARIGLLVEQYGERFTARVYTPEELANCRGRVASLAARWAAKEAAAKALGVGMGAVSFREIVVLQDDAGKPALHLLGNARQRAAALGLASWSVSLSHDAGLALAFVVALHEPLIGEQTLDSHEEEADARKDPDR
ncbi:MAG: holo-[acyl-carrier-protein] synthase [Chloroflexi bacterium]|nr:holo-[acyl-carrier-protein] synthase [Chloroflexota bacterium]